MRTKEIIINRIRKPVLCLSPLRALKKCHKCQIFKKYLNGSIKQLKCNPQLTKEALKLISEKQRLLKQLREINKKLKEL